MNLAALVLGLVCVHRDLRPNLLAVEEQDEPVVRGSWEEARSEQLERVRTRRQRNCHLAQRYRSRRFVEERIAAPYSHLGKRVGQVGGPGPGCVCGRPIRILGIDGDAGERGHRSGRGLGGSVSTALSSPREHQCAEDRKNCTGSPRGDSSHMS